MTHDIINAMATEHMKQFVPATELAQENAKLRQRISSLETAANLWEGLYNGSQLELRRTKDLLCDTQAELHWELSRLPDDTGDYAKGNRS